MSLINKAQSYCESYKYRFTEPRQRVLEVIVEQNSPITAYNILRLLSVKKDINPPTVYRAIEFWSQHSFIHRVESMNSYIACNSNHKHKGIQVLICDECGLTKEICINDLTISANIRKKEAFLVKNWNMEVHGICSNCA